MLCSVVCVGGRREEGREEREVGSFWRRRGREGVCVLHWKIREKEKKVEKGKISNGRAWTYFCRCNVCTYLYLYLSSFMFTQYLCM